jgi:cytochrome c-type biogenesis protein CcmH
LNHKIIPSAKRDVWTRCPLEATSEAAFLFDNHARTRTHVATAETDTNTQHRAADGGPVSRISGTVQIAPFLAGSVAPGTALFVYATDPDSPGPPLAVLRLRVDRWPVSFVLDDAECIVPGRNLSAAMRIQLEARISPSGEALPRPGDLIGKLESVDPQTTQSVNISIDQKIA